MSPIRRNATTLTKRSETSPRRPARFASSRMSCSAGQTPLFWEVSDKGDTRND
jgi:hypothetical protein